MSKVEQRSKDLRLDLSERLGTSMRFRVDHDGELEIEAGNEFTTLWLTRVEGRQLLDLLTEWLK